MYELMCAVDAYYRIHPSGPDGGSSWGGILFPNTSSTDSLESLSNTIKFIDNCLRCFE